MPIHINNLYSYIIFILENKICANFIFIYYFHIGNNMY